MHTSAGLLDLHTRSHQSLEKLLDHCAGFSDEELNREIEGFGVGSMLQQFDHTIGAEAYWVGVVNGLMLAEELDQDRPSIEALRAFRDETVATTVSYLGSASADELNTRRPMVTWGGKAQDLVPAQVILRTQTHLFQHKGQLAAMCRLLGRPVPHGLDFPLGPA